MKKIYLILVLVFTSGFLFSQEICDNGIDDDGDGLIDLQDTVDCACTVTTSVNVPSLIPNPSFEDHSCCPSSWSQLNCADTWIQASDATSDYFNTCDYTGAAPQPFPNGNGVAGFFPLTNWKEYIGACLLNPLQAGVSYSFNFDMAHNTVNGTFGTCTSGPYAPIDITIYGTTTCSDLPFSGYDCPIGQGNWQVLGTVTVDPSGIFNSWSTFTATFTPPVDIYAIVIGPPCNLPAGYPSNSASCDPYFYIDNLILNQSAAFNPMQIIVSGDYCTNDLVLSAHNDSLGTYQWYQDSIALVGETNDSLFISAGGYPLGDYEVVFTYANGMGCVTDTVHLSTPPLIVSTSNDTTICNNDTATITAYGGGTYSWDNGLGTNSSYSVTPHSTTTYHVTVSNSHGCSDVDSIKITVNPLPTADFTIDSIPCFSDNLTVTYTGNAQQSATYTWDFNGGVASPGTGQGPHQVSWSQSGTFNITLQVTENGCTSLLNTQSVLNPPLLTTDITPQNLLCFEDNTGEATVNVSGGTIASDYNYYWSNSQHTQTISNLAAGIYTVTVIDDNHCSSVSSVTITQPDKIQVTLPVNIYLCNGRSTIITATTTGGTPNYNYIWNGVPGGSTLIDNPSVTQTYNVIVEDANGCTDSSQTIVYVSEPVHLELISNKDSICPGEEVQITANINSPAGGPYELSLQDSGIIATPFSVIVNDTSDYIVATVKDGCGSTDTDSLKLNFYPIPEVDFSPNIYNGCQPLVVKFNQNIAYNSNFYYVWDFGDNQQDNLSYDYNPEHTFTESGSFDVSLTVRSDKGCENTKLINNLITVYPKPDARFIASPEVVSLIKPEVEFINLSTITDTSYWDFMDGDTSNATNPLHYFKESGTYNVELIVTSSLGCRDTITGKVIVEDPITFYAPTAFTPDHDGINDEFMVKASGIEKDNFLFQIYDRWGEVIFESTDIEKGWNGISNGHKEISPIGSYTWVCTFVDIQGNAHKKTGVFTLYK